MAGKRGPPRAPEGVEFPLDEENRRSTMKFNSSAFEASVAGVDPGMAAKIREEAPKWRKKYSKYVIENVMLSSKSTKNALAIANAGLDFLHNNMVFIRNERSMPLRTAMSEFKQDSFATGMVKGKGRMPERQEFQVPYKNKTLKSDELLMQIDKWVHEGVIEVSCGHALNEMVRNEGWLDLSDLYVVMLGASSAMGPYEFLMTHGANVIAVDIDRPHIWKKLLTIAEGSPGTITFPLKSSVSSKDISTLAEHAGCNLLTQTPEIRNWLVGVHKGKSLAVGCYAYLDGALFVKLSMAMDAITKDLVAARKNVALAYLCTPTDCHIGTSAASTVATKTYKKSPLWQSLLSIFVSTMPGLKSLKRNAYRHVESEDGKVLHCVDAIVPEQGPNYILAKRLQHWRAIISREKGCIVSSNIAPSTRTLSVVHNIQFKMAYGGMGHFRPMEVFDQETSSAVMAGLLVYDLKCVASASHPSTELANPLCLFSENSFHGGAWRCGYKFSSIGPSSILVYLVTNVLVPLYLFLYNMVQFMGWSYVAWITISLCKAADWNVQAIMEKSPWDAVSVPLRFFQDLAFMEVVHCLFRLTPSSWFTTLIQIMSRVLLVEGLAVTPQAQNNVFIYGLLFAWGITEVVRYSYYALKLAGLEISLLTWLRYSLFLVLYPTGVLSELFCLRKVVYFFPIWGGENWLTTSSFVQMLGVENTKFLIVTLYCGLYVPFFPMLFGLMLRQRKKILGRKPRNKVKTH